MPDSKGVFRRDAPLYFKVRKMHIKRKAYEMKHKFFYRLTIFILTLCLVTNVFEETSIKSRAFILEAALGWEFLEAVLMSAGVTYMFVDGVDHIFNPTTTKLQENYDMVIAELNRLDPGLGTALNDDISNPVYSASGWTVSLSEQTWIRLLSVSRSLTEGVQMELGSINIPAQVATPQEVVYSTMQPIWFSYLPMNYNSGIRERITEFKYDVSSGGLENWNRFVELAGSEGFLLTAIYAVNDSGYGGLIYLIATQDNIPISSISVTDDGLSLSVLDQDGVRIPFAYSYLIMNVVGSYWEGVYMYPDMDMRLSQRINKRDIMIPGIVNSMIDLPAAAGVNAEVSEYIAAETYDVVTPGRTLTKIGTLAGNITITLPNSLDFEKELKDLVSGIKPITDVLPKIGVIPVDLADEKVIGKDMTITEAIEATETIPAVPPAASEFDLGLANFFPFCIPFDFAKFISVFKAEPEAPTFKWKFPVGKDSSGIIYEEYIISLEQFDTVAFWCRKLELLAFIVGLMLATRSMFIRS